MEPSDGKFLTFRLHQAPKIIFDKIRKLYLKIIFNKISKLYLKISFNKISKIITNKINTTLMSCLYVTSHHMTSMKTLTPLL